MATLSSDARCWQAEATTESLARSRTTGLCVTQFCTSLFILRTQDTHDETCMGDSTSVHLEDAGRLDIS